MPNQCIVWPMIHAEMLAPSCHFEDNFEKARRLGYLVRSDPDGLFDVQLATKSIRPLSTLLLLHKGKSNADNSETLRVSIWFKKKSRPPPLNQR